MAQVTIKFFGPARDLAARDAMQLEIAPGDTLGALAGKLAAAVPALADKAGLRLALNRAYVPLNHPLKPGDEIAIIPPVSGG